ncbi:MAG: MBL fold metallo-hydrolase [Phycisphaerae bacterium]
MPLAVYSIKFSAMMTASNQVSSLSADEPAPRNLTGNAGPHETPLLPALAVVKTPYFHLLGYSVAGEETVIQAPELNVVFDIGKCPRPMLTSDFCLLTHGHMDHSAGLAYYLSQRFFQGMTPGTIICPVGIAEAVTGVIRSWTALEGKAIEHRVIGLKIGEEYELRKGLIVRTFATRHTVPSAGFLLLDRREKLKPELAQQQLPGHILRDMKARGEKITYTLDIPLIAYTGDTSMSETLLQDGVRDARVLLTECTFFEPGHCKRAAVGQHLHLKEFMDALPKLENELVLITHLSRRTYLRWAQKTLQKAMAGLIIKPRVEFFMDHAQKLQVRPGKAAAFIPVEPAATIDTEDV